MNLKLISNSTIDVERRVVVKYLSNQKLFTDYGNGFVIYDYNFNVINSFEVEFPLLITHYYFSKKHKYFLWYCDSDSYICLLDLTQPDVKPIKINLSEDLILYPYYTSDNEQFIIAGDKAFLSFDVKKQEFSLIDNRIVQEKYPFFKVISYYSSLYRVLFYDFEKEIIVYRTNEREQVNTVYVKHPIKTMNVQFEAPCAYIHTASYLDGVLVLVEDDNFIFYYLDKEFYRIVNTKDIWLFRTVDLFLLNNKVQCILFSYFFNGPENTIEIYEIEK